jgi:hypothetical protein
MLIMAKSKHNKIAGYFIQLPDETLEDTAQRYPMGFHASKEQALRSWSECVALGLVTKRTKPKVFQLRVHKVK